jgi:hypothetical protein
VTGNITVPDTVSVGEEVSVLPPSNNDWFTGRLKVVSVQHDEESGFVLGLEDLVVHSPEEAAQLAARFQSEAGLFCDVYE